MRTKLISSALFAFATLSARQPWWTGTLLSSNGKPSAVGEVRAEEFATCALIYGTYSSDWQSIHTKKVLYESSTELVIATGLAPRLDVLFLQSLINKTRGHVTHTDFSDSFVLLRYALVEEHGSWPVISFVIGEVFPTGRFSNLDPLFTDVQGTGNGAYTSYIGTYWQKSVCVLDGRWLRWRFNCSYTIPSYVHIKGATTHGGQRDTNGILRPGNGFRALGAFELQITQEWVWSCDFVYEHFNRDSFRGSLGSATSVGSSSTESVSIAPAIEYNFCKYLGIIGGVWLTLAGRNSEAFYTPIIALNSTF